MVITAVLEDVISLYSLYRGKIAITEQFLAGAQKASAETDYIFLEKKKMHPCFGCFACWFKTLGKCVFKDDMQELLDQYMRSDIIVLQARYMWAR